MEHAPRQWGEPAPPLRGLVRSVHGYLVDDGTAGVHHGLPDTSLTLVLAFDEPIEVGWLAAPASTVRRWSVVSGLHEGPAVIRHDGFQHGVQLQLTPSGCRALLGVPAAALRDELVELDDVVAAAAPVLYDAVAGARCWNDRFRLLDAGLVSLLDHRTPRPVAPELREAWRLLHRHPTTRVETVAEEVGWSRRRLHARLVAEVGIGPKQVARLVRFRRARAGLLRGEPIGSVAAAAGYSDQPHLTREWRALAGRTPGEWLREERPFVQDAQVRWEETGVHDLHDDAVALPGLP